MDIQKLEQEALANLSQFDKELDEVALYNTEKVIRAFRDHKVADFYLKPSTGYAYSDMGRDQLDLIFAQIFHTEAALVRSQFSAALMHWPWQ